MIPEAYWQQFPTFPGWAFVSLPALLCKPQCLVVSGSCAECMCACTRLWVTPRDILEAK